MSGNYGYENQNLIKGLKINHEKPQVLTYINERGLINFNLDPKEKLKNKLIPYFNIQQVNDDYLVCTDAWDEIRGLPSIFSIWFSVILLIISSSLLFFLFYALFKNEISFALIIGTFALIGSTYLLIKIFNISFGRELFGYTHYPLIFNRKKQELHYFEPYQKKWISAPWSDYHFSININENHEYAVNASLIDQNEIIQQVVVFPFRFRSLSLVEGHWEFFRRYMAGEDLEKLKNNIHYYAPNVIDRKEIARETWFRLKLLRFSERDYFTDQVKLPSDFNLNLLIFGIPQFLIRRLCVRTSKIPQVPKEWIN
ncbi:hypothetical protein [Acinetobacter indicus]|uniref:hypothetical protein n=1 Tax=Acinetobacter indicus TaxID=756892 RepID=UPI00197BDCB1|nr:hypothetical protein [Acinetobacter indicus]QSG85125.1 hypothetical protein JYB86_03120 [Acinetobacter indicus]